MIGVFDSGVGGLTVLREIHKALPAYSTIYFGDGANAPYGEKTHEEIARLTWRGVDLLFQKGCPLVILACNSASAQALREIQQNQLKQYPGRRVLGVIIPTVEEFHERGYKNILVLGTPATVSSQSYVKEFEKADDSISIAQYACPRWVPLVEAGELDSSVARQVVQEDVEQALAVAPGTEAILLGCTHYPYLYDLIREVVPERIAIYDQGSIVAKKLMDYLKRHPEMDELLEKKGKREVFSSKDGLME